MMGWSILRAVWLAGMMGGCALAAARQTAGQCAGQMAKRVVTPLPDRAGAMGLGDRIAAILAPAAVARDHWGIQVTTLDGTVLYSLNEGQLFQPASDAKLFTTAAAMALLGPNQRFTTRVEFSAPSDGDKTIRGDVVLHGDGDGDLSERSLPYVHLAEMSTTSPTGPITPLRYLAEFADGIQASGATHIAGDVIGDDTIFPWAPYPHDWSIDDMVWGYGAPVSGLSVNDNELQLTVTPGKLAGEPPTLVWQAGMPTYYSVDATDLTTGAVGSGSHVQMERYGGSKTLRVYGSIAVDAAPDAEQIAIADPAEFAAIALKWLLEARGIHIDGVARANHRAPSQSSEFLAEFQKPIPNLPNGISPEESSRLTGKAKCADACDLFIEHTSPPVFEDIILTNKISQNLHAELLLHHLAMMYGERDRGGGRFEGSTVGGVRVVRQFLINAGIDDGDFVFFDGSGLSGHDLVTPRATAQLLSFAAHDAKTGEAQPWFAAWKTSLPVGGVDGTLSGRFAEAPLKGHVFAKTGTLGEARALSGYLDAASGRTIIFSIYVGNHLPNTSDDREAMDAIVTAIQATE